ncbi:MAG: hypothetical protein U5K32_05410 [Bacteroidales bacterium]|nr:hypothetical protein [Bacteroidales bacterium]
MEGPALYCEYMFYNHFASFDEGIKNNYNHKHFWGILTTPFYGRNNLRKRHLAAGMAMCFILNQRFDDWQTEYYTDKLSLYDFFISKFNPQKEELEIGSAYFKLSNYHTGQEILQHQVSFDQFNAQNGIKITLNFNQRPQFKGFDPMNPEPVIPAAVT